MRTDKHFNRILTRWIKYSVHGTNQWDKEKQVYFVPLAYMNIRTILNFWFIANNISCLFIRYLQETFLIEMNPSAISSIHPSLRALYESVSKLQKVIQLCVLSFMVALRVSKVFCFSFVFTLSHRFVSCCVHTTPEHV